MREVRWCSIVQHGSETEGDKGKRMASLLSNALLVLVITSFQFAVIFGKSCSIKSDCSVGQSCCSNVCLYDCSGYPCSSSNNCSVGQDCWQGYCTNNYIYHYSYDYYPVFTPLVVVSSLVVFFIVLMFIYYCYRRARLGRPGRVQMERQVTTTVVTTTQPATQASPQAHQHGYPYQSLPQNDQYQNAAPPPYSGRMVTGSDLPPLYNSRTQRKPDGGHTSPPAYGSL